MTRVQRCQICASFQLDMHYWMHMMIHVQAMLWIGVMPAWILMGGSAMEMGKWEPFGIDAVFRACETLLGCPRSA